MTITLEGGEGSASRPGRSLLPGKTRYPLYRRLGGPQGRSGQVRKISPIPGFDHRTVQPVASRLTYIILVNYCPDTKEAGYLLTYLLTPCSRVLLEKLTGLQLVKKFSTFYGTRRFITAAQEPTTCPYPGPARSSPYPHIPLPEDSF